jgi:hypothetical protein
MFCRKLVAILGQFLWHFRENSQLF